MFLPVQIPAAIERQGVQGGQAMAGSFTPIHALMFLAAGHDQVISYAFFNIVTDKHQRWHNRRSRVTFRNGQDQLPRQTVFILKPAIPLAKRVLISVALIRGTVSN